MADPYPATDNSQGGGILMADEPDSKQPADSNASSDWGSASENDVEQKLAQAAELATELAGELGPAPADAQPLKHDGADDPLQVIEKGLDAELGELEQLVGKAQAEVGSDAAAPDRAMTGGAAQVPDFMSEFMSPAPTREGAAGASPSALETSGQLSADVPPQNAATAASGAACVSASAKPPALTTTSAVTAAAYSDAASAAGTAPSSAHVVKPGVIATKTVAGAPSDAKGNAAAAEAPSPDPDATTNSPDVSLDPTGEAEQSGLPRPLMFKLCERGVRVLERIDRPFVGVGARVRYVVGFIAIATAVASIVVFIASLR